MWFRVEEPEEPEGAAAEMVRAKVARAMKDFIFLRVVLRKAEEEEKEGRMAGEAGGVEANERRG